MFFFLKNNWRSQKRLHTIDNDQTRINADNDIFSLSERARQVITFGTIDVVDDTPQ